MKSVEKCKRYSAFYPEKQELPHSLACVYWPVITSPRWRRVDTRAKGQQGVYVCMSMAIITVEILSNMETKLVLVLHVDHKPLNIQTTQLNRLRNVNAIVLFIQKHCSCSKLAFAYSPDFNFPRWRRVGMSQQS